MKNKLIGNDELRSVIAFTSLKAIMDEAYQIEFERLYIMAIIGVEEYSLLVNEHSHLHLNMVFIRTFAATN